MSILAVCTFAKAQEVPVRADLPSCLFLYRTSFVLLSGSLRLHQTALTSMHFGNWVCSALSARCVY